MMRMEKQDLSRIRLWLFDMDGTIYLGERLFDFTVELLAAIRLGRSAMRRIQTNFALTLSLNTLFLAGGLSGILGPGISALLHNLTTLGVCFNASRHFLPKGGNI